MITLLRARQVQALTGLSRTNVYEDPRLRPVRIGPRAVAWVESEVQEWLADRISERDRTDGS